MEEKLKKWDRSSAIALAILTLFVGYFLGVAHQSYITKNNYFSYCKPAVEKTFGELTEAREKKALAFGEDFIVIKEPFLGDSSKATIIRTPHIIDSFYDDSWKDKYFSTVGEKYYGKSTGYFKEIEDLQQYWKSLVKEERALREAIDEAINRRARKTK